MESVLAKSANYLNVRPHGSQIHMIRLHTLIWHLCRSAADRRLEMEQSVGGITAENARRSWLELR